MSVLDATVDVSVLDATVDVSDTTVDVSVLDTTVDVSDTTVDVSVLDATVDVSVPDSDTDENSIIRDKTNNLIYIRKILKRKEKVTNNKKTGTRVYNTVHACLYCKKLVQHIRAHLKSKHHKEEQMMALLTSDDDQHKDQSFSLLRALGDDKHNCAVIAEGAGEFLLTRRPDSEFTSVDFGPCPKCREWMLKTSLPKHQKKCNSPDKTKRSRKDILPQSEMISGRLSSSASKLLREEVFKIMTADEISKVAQNDPLIVMLGESWLRRNLSNKLKRKYYSSQRMRVNARLLIELRKKKEKENSAGSQLSDEAQQVEDADIPVPLCDFLVPARFDNVAKAAIDVSLPYFDDEEQLKAPSNAIKVCYDLIRLVNAKWASIQKNQGSKEEAVNCEVFLQLIKVEWSEKVTRLARSILAERQLHSRKEIPSPDDVQKIVEFIKKELKLISLRKKTASISEFRKLAILVQTRLLIFNKRRSGEIDAIR